MSNETALVPVKKSSTELIKELAKAEGNTSLVAVLDRMTQLESVNKSAVEVISAADDLVAHYLKPGPKRFKRVVRLKKALDQLKKQMG